MNSAHQLQGYCPQCHEPRRIASGTFCPVCATALVDLHALVGDQVSVGAGGPSSPPVVTGGWQDHRLPPPAVRPSSAPLLTPPPPKRSHRHGALVAVLFVGLLAVVSAVVLAVTTLSDDGTSAADQTFEDAHTAFVAGRCSDAVGLYDGLLQDPTWVGSSSAADQARQERTECSDLLAITAGSTDASVVLDGYLTFLRERPDTALVDVVVADVQRLYESAGRAALTPQSCDELDAQTFTAVIPAAATDAMLGCAATYESAGRQAEAYALAVDVLTATDDATLADDATRIVVHSPEACSNLAEVRQLVDLAGRPDDHAALLQSCITAATARQDLDTVATLQIDFLTELPSHRDAPAVEAALIDNVAACAQLDTMQATPAIAGREGFLPTETLACAQVSEYVGDREQAIERYQWFLDNAPSDPRNETARSGLARVLIAHARQEREEAGLDAQGFDRPPRSAGTGSDRSRLVIYNDHPEQLEVVMSGPESRIETVAASPTSVVYSGGDSDCRFDVPSITIDLAPGDYDVMLRRPGYIGIVSTWTFAAGAEYSATYCSSQE